MEPLPRGANFIRAKFLWEIGLDVAGDPTIPYGGNRDMQIVVGSGGQDHFKPALKLGTGSAIIAHEVMKGTAGGGFDMCFVNPSALLTQAYRGTGLFTKPLPVRIVCSYPSIDRFVMVVHPRTGLKTVRDIKEKQYPLKLSVREDPTHSTFSLIDQIFAEEGFTLKDMLSWGGELVTTGAPMGPKRMDRVKDGTVDAVMDEAIVVWLADALKAGYTPLDIDPKSFANLERIGWRKKVLTPKEYPGLKRDYVCADFSGWPVYCRESMDEKVVYDVCEAIAARTQLNEMPWAMTGDDPNGDFKGLKQLFSDTEATPIDVPLHPGVERFLKDKRL
jgi:TRAP-type uncharacterized transport system substrate-binding protein